MMWKRVGKILAVLCLAGSAADAVELPEIFGDNMVIRAGKPFQLHGTAVPGERVTISGGWLTEALAVRSGTDGKWSANLGIPEGRGPFAVTVFGGGKTLRLRNVVAGEIWLCAGQSNMEMPVGYLHENYPGVLDFETVLAGANAPELRFFTLSRRANPPMAEAVREPHGRWEVCTPATAAKFSAVGYFFGRKLQENLKMPVGLIDNSWGGTRIQSWLSPELQRELPQCAPYLRWAAEQKLAPDHRHAPGAMFQGRMLPLAGIPLSGILWYQGEGNGANGWLYKQLLPELIAESRRVFRDPALPFVVIQLPSLFKAGTPPRTFVAADWAEMREAQAAAARMPEVYYTVNYDCADPEIHFRDKRPVGERPALLALDRIYRIGAVGCSPEFRLERFENGEAILRVDQPLTVRGERLQGFALAGADRKFHPAEAALKGDVVAVQCAAVPHPVAVRFAWSHYPDANLFSAAGLPVAPYRSDDWPGITDNKMTP